MMDKKRTTTSREWVQAQESRYQQEIVAVALVAMIVFLSLAFFSYSAHDSTLFHYASDQETVANWAGVLGANIAAFFFFLIGSAAYLFLASLLFPVYLLLYKKPLAQEWRRMCMLGVLVVLIAMIAGVYQIDPIATVPGGLVGSSCAPALMRLAGAIGGQIIVWSTFWIMVSMLIRLPLSPIVLVPARKLRMLAGSAWAWIKSKRERKDIQSDGVIGGVLDHEIWRLDGSNPENAVQELERSQILGHGVGVQAEAKKDNREVSMRRVSMPRKIMGALMAQLPNTVLAHNPVIIEKRLMEAARKPVGTFQLPDEQLFAPPAAKRDQEDAAGESRRRAKMVEEKLNHFGVKGSIVAIKPGPVVTLFEYKPDIDSKISKIVALEDDLAMALTAQSMRIIAPIPGKNAVGFEIANNTRDDVSFSQIFSSPVYQQTKARLPIVLGVDVVGNPIVDDLATTPHLLVGGATGSGKSVGLNVMLISLLCKLGPDDLKMILIDPKRLEFTPYAHIPHLVFPIVTQPARAAAVLSWVVQEMEARYEAMASAGVRSFSEYRILPDAPDADSAKTKSSKAYLVVIIDELADLMMVAGKEVETQIVRIAQMARAAGIHLIVATQRPSVDVVTGLIKVNFPSRVAFRVSSKVDSRTILDLQGAEKLLGKGDMLYMHASSPELKRVHGAYVSDKEIERVADFLREQRQAQYLDLQDVLKLPQDTERSDAHDELYGQICEFVKSADEISISMIQRHYRIGFNRSARLIEKLELDGLIAPAQGSKPRKVIR